MSLLTRFNPIKALARLDPMADFENAFRGLGMQPMFRDFDTLPEIRMDVEEDEKYYKVKAEIPGVKKEAISISIERNIISIGAEVKRETETKEGAKNIHTERYYGNVFRSFTLPLEVDDSKADAQFENGVLTLTLPKKPNAQTRRIQVH